MEKDIFIPESQQNKWERVFEEMLDAMDFSLVRLGRGYYGLSDKQGANLGGIESSAFKFDEAERVLDRMDTYIHDYFIVDLEDELRDYEIHCPTDAEIEKAAAAKGIRFISDPERHWILHKLLPQTDPKHGPQFIKDHQFEYDALDLILHHSEEVNLDHISAIETDRKIHIVSVSETYVKQFYVLADSDEEACEIVDRQWTCGDLGEMSGDDYLSDSYQIDDVTVEMEDYPADFELVERDDEDDDEE